MSTKPELITIDSVLPGVGIISPVISPTPKDAKAAKLGREKRLLAVVAIVVVSWLIVKVWADVFELFVRRVLKIKKNCFFSNLIVAVLFTGGILWVLYILDIDEMI